MALSKQKKWIIAIVAIIVLFIIGTIMKRQEDKQREISMKKTDDSLVLVKHVQDSIKTAEYFAWNALPTEEKRRLAQKKKATADSLEKAMEQERMMETPLAYLELKDFNWNKGGFGSVALFRATFINKGVRNARDIIVLAEYSGESGKLLNNKKLVLPIIVKAGKQKRTDEINAGFINSQVKSMSLKILDASFD